MQDADAKPDDARPDEANSKPQEADPKPPVTSAKAVADGKPAGGHSLQQQSQNPVADLISLPFQYNKTFNSGRRRNQTNVLNIQPVYPMHLNDEWNLINRLIIPLTKVPSPAKGVNGTSGLGDTTPQMFFSPAESDPIWGVGPILYFPTASSDKLGTDQWGLGPSAVVLKIEGPWVYGGVGQHIWTVPLGGGFGRLVHSKIPVNYSLQAFYNVHHPRNAGNWSMRFQATLLFPKKKPGDRSTT